jgi:hypothetical protein
MVARRCELQALHSQASIPIRRPPLACSKALTNARDSLDPSSEEINGGLTLPGGRFCMNGSRRRATRLGFLRSPEIEGQKKDHGNPIRWLTRRQKPINLGFRGDAERAPLFRDQGAGQAE